MDELEALKKKIAEMQSRADEIYRQRREEAISQAKALIKEYSMSAKELALHAPTTAATVHKVGEPQYQFGIHFWTDKGRRLQWVLDHLEKGGSLEDLHIK